MKEAEAFEKVFGRDHRTTLFKDVSLVDEAVVDGGQCVPLGVRPSSYRDLGDDKNRIAKGSKFDTFLELKMWLDNYSVTHYRPHKVVTRTSMCATRLHVHVKMKRRSNLDLQEAVMVVELVERRSNKEWQDAVAVVRGLCVQDHGKEVQLGM